MLKKPQHEVFARALARGSAQVDAYAEAGYRRRCDCASRLASHADVQARVEALRKHNGPRGANLDLIIEDLLRLARKAEEMNSSAGLSTARGALQAAAKLSQIDQVSFRDPDPPKWRTLSKEEWLKKHHPDYQPKPPPEDG